MVNFELFTSITANGGAANPVQRGVVVSSTNTYYSNKITANHSAARAAQFEWTGTPTGTITRWESDKAEPSEADDTDWVQDAGFSPTNPAGSASKFRNETVGRSARWTRYKYVNASGSGVLYGRSTVGGNG